MKFLKRWTPLLALTALGAAVAWGISFSRKGPPGTLEGMVWIPGGEFAMGTDAADAWNVEKPAHRVRVRGFWMDVTEVTNEQFKKFVDATGYLTTAEKVPTLSEIMKQVPPGTPPPAPEALVAGSMVFTPPSHAVPLNNPAAWWTWTPGANWRHPEGPGSSIGQRMDHPVVQVSWDDASAYARWAGKRLPTEAEWEFAARGGLEGKKFTWGDDLIAPGKPRCNIWQGAFPHSNSLEDGYLRTSPGRSFEANGYGLYGMAGNVWEWCSDWFAVDMHARAAGHGVEVNPRGPDACCNPSNPYQPERVVKGGSFLCHDSYCSGYRPSARRGTAQDTGMSHVGFRCVKDP
jgi:formylglycine-generating enzyme required for sulfatase activity